jgi:uncharacterized membrane protein YgdD (TMEM256/DUF423 family)
MRLLHIFAALSGALALIMLTIAAHALPDATAQDIERLHLGGFIQLITAASALAIANRAGKLRLIAGAMMLAGAFVFSGALYALAITHARGVAMLAPFGGMTLILGWIVLAFAKPAPH